MTRQLPTLAVYAALALGPGLTACGPKTEPNEPTQRPADRPADMRPAEPPREPPGEPPGRARPRARPAAGTVTVTATEARAKRLPPIAFSLDANSAGWTVRKLPGQGMYLQLSGPPGGPLFFSVHAFPNPRTTSATLVRWVRSQYSKPYQQPVTLTKPARFTLAGVARPAAALTSGRSMGRTASCAVLVTAPTTPPTALVVHFGHGAMRGLFSCDQIAKHPPLARVIGSFKLLP
jgi:hypothetical protein